MARRFIDLTGAGEDLKAELYGMAGELDDAQRQLAAERDRSARTVRRVSVGALLLSLIAGALGWWRGSRQRAIRMTVKAHAPEPAAPKKGAA